MSAVLSPAAIDSLLGVRPPRAAARSNVPSLAPLPLTRRQVAHALDALVGEAIHLARDVERGRVPFRDLAAVAALVAEARAALADFRRE